MNVCVLGNSHVAALRMAIDSGNCPFPYRLDFYSAPQPHVKNRRIHPLATEGKIHTTVDGAAENGLDIFAYDAIVLSAAGYRAYRNENSHFIFEMRLPAWAMHTENGNPQLPIVSSGLFESTIMDGLSKTWAIDICSQLANDFHGKIIIQPWPLPSATILKDTTWKICSWYGDKAAEISSYYYKTQYRAIIKLMSNIRADIVVLDYPDQTWPQHGFTPPEYETRDPWHMNDKYGGLVIKQIADSLL